MASTRALTLLLIIQISQSQNTLLTPTPCHQFPILVQGVNARSDFVTARNPTPPPSREEPKREIARLR